MNSNSKQQEILLMTNTRFSSRRWLKINETASDKNLSQKEQLKEACWNGLAPEILPECFDNINIKLHTLWEINDANAFIDLEFGGFMERKAGEYSVNPYVFMEVQVYN
ncbi:MAG: hypothetical protein JWP81_3964 [Ferruginibacter sp.]|nr:hypothetical protein [Ferruginibacter sp.]